MKQTLEAIAELSTVAGSPEWDVTEIMVNQSAPRYEIRGAYLNVYGAPQTMDFGTDSAAAYLAAASVTVAPELASGVLELLRMAENLPAEADGNARAMAEAVLNLVQNLPEVEDGGMVTP